MRRVRAVADGVWEFVVGDDWITAAGVVLALGLTALAAEAGTRMVRHAGSCHRLVVAFDLARSAQKSRVGRDSTFGWLQRPALAFGAVNGSSFHRVVGDVHRHGLRVHAHAHAGPHVHAGGARLRSRDHADGDEHADSHDLAPGDHGHSHEHDGHSHGLIHPSIKRSREGLIAVGLSLAVLGATALAQTAIFLMTNSVALLADLIHNFGDALTAVPLAIAFILRSERAERFAGLFVVAAIFISACVAGFEAVSRLIHPQTPTSLVALALAGALGYGGNWVAATIRTRAGHRLDSPALIADGNHARADAYVRSRGDRERSESSHSASAPSPTP